MEKDPASVLVVLKQKSEGKYEISTFAVQDDDRSATTSEKLSPINVNDLVSRILKGRQSGTNGGGENKVKKKLLCHKLRQSSKAEVPSIASVRSVVSKGKKSGIGGSTGELNAKTENNAIRNETKSSDETSRSVRANDSVQKCNITKYKSILKHNEKSGSNSENEAENQIEAEEANNEKSFPVDEAELLPFSCPDCPTHFRSESQLKCHRLTHEHGTTQYKCEQCNSFFLGQHFYQKHLAEHKSWAFKCLECGMQFNRKLKLLKHMKTDHNSKDETPQVESMKTYKCYKCDTDFQSSKLYKEHRMHAHPVEEPDSNSYQCSICNKILLKSRMAAHIRLHTGEKPFECETCHDRFRTKHQLCEHRKIHPREVKPFPCTICGLNFSHQYRLKVHTMSKHKTLKCGSCELMFYTNKELKEHERLHKHECTKCKARFRSKGALKTHMLEHPKKGSALFMCGTCNAFFTVKPALIVHMRTHSDTHIQGKTFVCDLCGVTFLNKINLRRHKIRIHTVETQFKCETCKAYFMSQWILDEHLKRHSTVLEVDEVPNDQIHFADVECEVQPTDEMQLAAVECEVPLADEMQLAAVECEVLPTDEMQLVAAECELPPTTESELTASTENGVTSTMQSELALTQCELSSVECVASKQDTSQNNDGTSASCLYMLI